MSPDTFSDRMVVAAHALTDGLIGLCYLAISATLLYLVYRARREIPFGGVLLAFGAFIVACGGTHFLHVAVLYAPGTLTYSLLAVVQGVTTAASLLTAIMLPPLVPRVLHLLEAARVSEQRKRELGATNEQLAAANTSLQEASELRTRFFANVSHELRTPLTLILASTEKLLALPACPDGAHRTVDVIERNARLLLRNVNDLLDVAKLDARKLELRYAEVNLAQLVQRTVAHFQGLAEERGITLSFAAPADLTAQIDADKIERALINVLANAFAFTPDSGQVSCAVAMQVPTQGTDVERVSISVGDSGPGVPKAMRAAVFERFRQAEGAARRHVGGTGTGLGLAIVKEFVELHGGTVALGEAPAGGALVTMVLPVRAPADASVADTVPTGVTDRAQVHVLPSAQRLVSESAGPGTIDPDRPLVLVAEDHPELACLLADTLGPTYRVVVASDGQTALGQALALRPDLILSDVMMPGLSGDQLLRAVRAQRELDGVPFVVLTAKADEALRVQLLREGAQDYVNKPFLAAELYARVGAHVQIKRTRDRLQRDLATRDDNLEALAHEIGDRKRQAEEALRARETFIAVAAHELKTPVTSLRTYAQLMVHRLERHETLDPVWLGRAAQNLEQQSGRLTRLVTTLLDSIGLDAGKVALDVRDTDLAALVRQVAQSAQAATGAHVVTVDAPPELWAQVDPIRFEQVMTNLLDNSIKYDPSGGAIEVAVSQRVPHAARILVRDHGIGIPPEKRARVMERFYQAHELGQHAAGLGLGLHICRRIVELHGGQIELHSPPDGGTAVMVTVPVRAQNASGMRQAEPWHASAAPGAASR